MSRPIRSIFCLFMSWFAWSAEPAVSRADFIMTTYGVPTADEGSWAYSTAVGVGHGNDITYQPLLSDWSTAVFRGFVHQGSSPSNWNTIGAGTHDEDTIYVFETFFLSKQNMTIPIHFDGDDGHSLYVNGSLIAGGGFAAAFDFDLILTADTPMSIEIGDYNGPGPMAVSFGRQGSTTSLDSEVGLMINALGEFPPTVAPEPTSLALAGFAGLGMAAGAWRRRRQQKQAAGPVRDDPTQQQQAAEGSPVCVGGIQA